MSLFNVTAGAKAPEEFNVVIEIPAHADPIKYEVDKETGALFVDRFLGTAMHYPCNYGYIPDTIAGDGDPVDVLVVTPFPLLPGVVVTCRAVGVLKMQDEAGGDEKIIAVPVPRLTRRYEKVHDYTDLPDITIRQVEHFFEHYKDLEPGKWVKVVGWGTQEDAITEITDGMKRANEV